MSEIPPSPVRKRPRLSLKATKKNPETPRDAIERKVEVNGCGAESQPEAQEEGNETDQLEEDVGPGVIGFENLGNTCFLNSVLQILRYTPGFVEGLEHVSKEITQTEKLKTQLNEHSKKQLGELYEKPEECLSWQVVRILHQLFGRMENREKKFRQMGSSAVATMTVKPDRLLEKIRQLNPMFEGYLQHDAQELLRCLLCYLQDAWKEIVKIKLRHKEVHKHSEPRGIAKYLVRGSTKQQAVCKSSNKTKCNLSAKMALFRDAEDILDSIENVPEINGLMGGNCLPHDESKSLCKSEAVEYKIPVLSNGVERTVLKSSLSYDETDSMSATHPQVKGESVPVRISPRTTANSLKLTNGNSALASSSSTPQMSEVSLGKRDSSGKKRGNKRKKLLSETVPELDKQDSEQEVSKQTSMEVSQPDEQAVPSKTQPSVLSLFGKREAGCKRLGMRGAVVAKVPNGQEAPNSLHVKHVVETAKTVNSVTTCLPDHTGDAKPDLKELCSLSITDDIESITPAVVAQRPVRQSPRKVPISTSEVHSFSSPSKRCNGVMEHVTENNLKSAALEDIKQATVKLEKCDPVCSSPLKSVSAHEAIKILGPAPDKQKDFVEHLFQGMMMLKTRCTECELARERREIFQDVSVPLRNNTPTDPRNVDESDEELEESSLSCLMSAFTDVERLCDDNKYFCENCTRYVEAERSLHYENLPEILTLHLKRFAASSGYFGNLTKINDHVATPDYLPCLRYKCPRPCHRDDHRYKLFGIIAHSGLSITSGHYMSYVRLLPNAKPVQSFTAHQLKKENPQGGSSITTLMGGVRVKQEVADKLVDGDRETEKTGIIPDVIESATGSALGAAALPGDAVSPRPANQPRTPVVSPEYSSQSQQYVNKWLECDDDFVQVLDEEDFLRRLAPNSGYNATPYVLFYIKDNDYSF